jgi:four helix bundle protein
LTSQLRRCSASMGANIAEGCRKKGNPERYRFLQIASGSATEPDCHLLLAKDLKYLAENDYSSLGKQLLDLRRMLTALVRKVGVDRVEVTC